MKIELRNLTIDDRLSQETTAFAADVWVDGKKAGHATNDGRGGATIVRLDPAVRDKFEAHGRKRMPVGHKRFVGGAEWIVDQLVDSTIQEYNKACPPRVEERVQAIMTHFSRPWRWFCADAWIVLEPPLGIITTETMRHVSQHVDARTVEAVFRATPHPGIYLQFRLRDSTTTTSHPALPRARK